MTKVQFKDKILNKLIFFYLILDKDQIKSLTLNKSGVYYWYNPITNNGYVGSSENLYLRLRRYYQPSYLFYKNNTDLPICRAIKKYLINNFYLVILEFTTKENIHIREQYFMDSLNPEYNVMKIAGYRSGKEKNVDQCLKNKN